MSAADYRTESTRLEVTRSETGDGAVFLAVAGEVDIGTVDILRDRITDVIGEPGLVRLVLDFGPLMFLDSSGIAALIAAQRLAEERAVEIQLINFHGTVRHVLEVTGIVDLFESGPR